MGKIKMTNTNNEMKQYFTQKEALEMVLETLNRGNANYIEELHHDTFSSDYYIVGTYEAKQALEQYGVFEAIKDVKEHETMLFGEMVTDPTSPEELANMLMYTVGDKVLNQVKSYKKYMDLQITDDGVLEEITSELEMMLSIFE